MPIVFAQPDPVGAAGNAGYAQGYGRGGGGGHPTQVIFPPTIPAPHPVHLGPADAGPPHENPVDAQLRLDQGRLSMAEELRYQRLQAGLAEVDDDPNLSDQDRADLKMMIKTGIDPYARRKARAQVAHMEAQTKFMMNQHAQMEALWQQQQKVRAMSLEDRMRDAFDPQRYEEVAREYDEAHPEAGAYVNAGMEGGLSDEQQALVELRRIGIESEVRARGGAYRMFLDGDGIWKPLQAGASGGQIAGEGGGTGTTGTRGSGGGLTPQQLLVERNKARDEAIKRVDDPSFDPIRAIRADNPQERAQVEAALTQALGSPEAMQQFMQLPVAQGSKQLRDLIKSNPGLRDFIENRIADRRLRENMAGLGLTAQGQPQSRDRSNWMARFAPPGATPPTRAPGDKPFEEKPHNEAQQRVWDGFSQAAQNISRLPAEQRRGLYGDLQVARDLFRLRGSTLNMQEEELQRYVEATNRLTPYSKPPDQEAQRTATRTATRQEDQRIDQTINNLQNRDNNRLGSRTWDFGGMSDSALESMLASPRLAHPSRVEFAAAARRELRARQMGRLQPQPPRGEEP